ncbi:hypothetical protein POTOM_022469 [Populus tomentosa]|uniref:3'-5' exonuclease domain-containing protein n=1 Tax=Populus tomentosa TaxID=118781 RepID=A0A8X7ZRM2_POPTO|nr:hypothetical protein POTOM_022469 [Populus tomentosa]
MENFELRCNHKGGNYIGGDDVFDVKCDDMLCYTTIINNPTSLLRWIAELFGTELPDRGNRLRVSMDMIWDKYCDDGRLKTPATLQFCHESCCIIYHVYPPDNFPTSSLENFLNHSCVDFVCFGLIEKVNYLRKTHNLEVKMEHWYDIPFMATVLDPNRFGLNFHSPLQDMVYIEFSKSYKKPDDLLKSNWRLDVPLPLDKVIPEPNLHELMMKSISWLSSKLEPKSLA